MITFLYFEILKFSLFLKDSLYLSDSVFVMKIESSKILPNSKKELLKIDLEMLVGTEHCTGKVELVGVLAFSLISYKFKL